MKKWILSLATMIGLYSAQSEANDANDPLWIAFNTISAKEKKEGAKSLNESERAFMLIWDLESEINNGGFHQYFFNSAGNHYSEANAALLKIGAIKTANILSDAMSLFPDGKPSKKREDRQKQLEVLSPDSNSFESHDERFLRYEEDVSGLALKYYEKNR